MNVEQRISEIHSQHKKEMDEFRLFQSKEIDTLMELDEKTLDEVYSLYLQAVKTHDMGFEIVPKDFFQIDLKEHAPRGQIFSMADQWSISRLRLLPGFRGCFARLLFRL